MHRRYFPLWQGLKCGVFLRFVDVVIEPVTLGWGDHEITALAPKEEDGAS